MKTMVAVGRDRITARHHAPIVDGGRRGIGGSGRIKGCLIRIDSMLSNVHCNFMSRTDSLTSVAFYTLQGSLRAHSPNSVDFCIAFCAPPSCVSTRDFAC